MTASKFPDSLAPLRTRRAWTHDAALREVTRIRRELAVLRENESTVAEAAERQSCATVDSWLGAPDPRIRAASLAWLSQREAERLAASRDREEAERGLEEALAHWERARAALDAVDEQTRIDRIIHRRNLQKAAQVDADADWLTRGSR